MGADERDVSQQETDREPIDGAAAIDSTRDPTGLSADVGFDAEEGVDYHLRSELALHTEPTKIAPVRLIEELLEASRIDEVEEDTTMKDLRVVVPDTREPSAKGAFVVKRPPRDDTEWVSRGATLTGCVALLALLALPPAMPTVTAEASVGDVRGGRASDSGRGETLASGVTASGLAEPRSWPLRFETEIEAQIAPFFAAPMDVSDRCLQRGASGIEEICSARATDVPAPARVDGDAARRSDEALPMQTRFRRPSPGRARASRAVQR